MWCDGSSERMWWAWRKFLNINTYIMNDEIDENELIICSVCGNETEGKYIMGIGEICTICEHPL